MRWLVRLLLFWLITGPIFYFFGLPYLLDMLSKKAQTEGYQQCTTHLASEGLTGGANAPVNAQQAETYCHCVSDGLTLTKNDLVDMVQKKPPTAMTAAAQAKAESCNKTLQAAMNGTPATPATAAPAQKTAEPDMIYY